MVEDGPEKPPAPELPKYLREPLENNPRNGWKRSRRTRLIWRNGDVDNGRKNSSVDEPRARSMRKKSRS